MVKEKEPYCLGRASSSDVVLETHFQVSFGRGAWRIHGMDKEVIILLENMLGSHCLSGIFFTKTI
jgi:hypothetical protein